MESIIYGVNLKAISPLCNRDDGDAIPYRYILRNDKRDCYKSNPFFISFFIASAHKWHLYMPLDPLRAAPQ